MQETFGEALRRLRGSRSLRQLGLLAFCSKSYVWDLETGRRKPTPEIAEVLEQALDAKGELLPLVPRPATPQSNQKALDRQAVLPLAAIHFSLPPASEESLTDTTVIASFRAADRQLGGGHLYGAVLHYLHHNIGPRIFGSGEDREAGQTFLAAASLTELAGWMAHDSGHDVRARGHFGKALPLAQAGNDPALSANIMASMSHLALQRGHLNEAVSLAQAGRKNANIGPRTPALSSRLYAMEARALAKQGEIDATQRALDAAHDELTTIMHEAPSQWTSSFDAAALASETALSLQDLGKLSAAVAEAERAISLRTGDRARSRVFGQISLAMIRIQQGELEAACAVGYELLSACRTLGSMRATKQLNELVDALIPHQDDQKVSDFLKLLVAVNQQRAVLFAGIGASPTTGGNVT